MRQRIVVSERCAPAYTLDGRAYLEPLRRWLYQRAEAVVFQTEEARRFFPEKVRKKGILIENPLKVDLPEPYHGEREKRFVAFSRLDKQKNIPMMLDAFRIFLKPIQDMYCLFTEEEIFADSWRLMRGTCI